MVRFCFCLRLHAGGTDSVETSTLDRGVAVALRIYRLWVQTYLGSLTTHFFLESFILS